ncbi:MAG TPA: hotdog domain-containing protein [Planctomycetota bacterium]|nr:hotdog domain-containing protein [Planctomycetota bacterium]
MSETCPRDPAIRTILMPKDTNASGTIFGGVILSHIDLAAVMEAHKVNAARRYVTVAMDKVVFYEPVFVGDQVSFYTELVKIGNTSVTAKVEVMVRRRSDPTREEVKVTEAEVVYVAVDENRRPVPVQ